MNIRHELETTATTDNWTEICAIAEIVMEDHEPQTLVTINDDKKLLRVVANCNGAALRDLVTALDQAGFLN